MSDDRIARKRGYIYCALALECSALYVGQTRGRHGALGRLSQHLAVEPPGTFRDRVLAISRRNTIGPVQFAAVELAPDKAFHGDARDYREGVEALIQYDLIEWLATTGRALGVISRVQLNRYARQQIVATEANRVAAELRRWLEYAVDAPGLAGSVGGPPSETGDARTA